MPSAPAYGLVGVPEDVCGRDGVRKERQTPPPAHPTRVWQPSACVCACVALGRRPRSVPGAHCLTTLGAEGNKGGAGRGGTGRGEEGRDGAGPKSPTRRGPSTPAPPLASFLSGTCPLHFPVLSQEGEGAAGGAFRKES